MGKEQFYAAEAIFSLLVFHFYFFFVTLQPIFEN